MLPTPVHPRVCGEHLPGCSLSGGDAGSSPRMRGTQRSDIDVQSLLRFIPAYAGNTRVLFCSCRAVPVHPRVCGEHCLSHVETLAFAGSSPRMRGTRKPQVFARGVRRFIPAYAGNTRSGQRDCRPAAVHPRVCGEHNECVVLDYGRNGSSPRMRGTRVQLHAGNNARRFIPAYAGNTVGAHIPKIALPVHPRVCGEHKYASISVMGTSGSSPRMRGTRCRKSRQAHRKRFIPAYAGNTSATIWRKSGRAVHPRVCGEHALAA